MCAHTLLSPKTRWRKPIEIVWDSEKFPTIASTYVPACAPAWTKFLPWPSCSMAQLHTRARKDTARVSEQLCRMEPTQTLHGILTGWGWPLLMPTESTDPEFWLGPALPEPMPSLRLKTYTSLSCSSTTSLWVEGTVSCWEDGEHTLRGIGTSSRDLQQLETWPCSQLGLSGHWAKEKTQHTPEKGKRYPGTESLKQDEPKQAHTKTYHTQNGNFSIMKEF